MGATAAVTAEVTLTPLPQHPEVLQTPATETALVEKTRLPWPQAPETMMPPRHQLLCLHLAVASKAQVQPLTALFQLSSLDPATASEKATALPHLVLPLKPLEAAY